MNSRLRQEVAAETVAAEPKFRELLTFASNVMLESAPIVVGADSLNLYDSDVGQAMQQIGLWNSAMALESGVMPTAKSIPDITEASDRLLLPFDRSIQSEIEAFGVAIIEEAFACLGEDAASKVEEFKTARSPREKAVVCNWLLERIADIKKQAIHQPDAIDDRVFFHPARLSPKFIGAYPETGLTPTCLGVSILMASFFEKTGAEYMHTGVARNASDEVRLTQLLTIHDVEAFIKERGIPMGNVAQDILGQAFSANIKALEHPGFHAAVIANLGDNFWIQTDPNYNSNIIMESDKFRPINEDATELQMINLFAKGLEVESAIAHDTPSKVYRMILHRLTQNIAEVSDVAKFLEEVPEETALSEIIAEYFKDFIDSDDKIIHDAFEFILGQLYECTDKTLSQGEDIQNRIQTMLIKYVFPDAEGDDITTCIKRCKTDPQYRQRRAEDLALVPLYLGLGLQGSHGNAVIDGSLIYGHELVDYGSPAYRIGACVLSDFAVYCGDELPLSFWMTYWPSIISFVEHNQQTPTIAQQVLRKQILADIADRDLKYSAINDIIFPVHE